jgi:nitrite reductase (NO-forming)
MVEYSLNRRDLLKSSSIAGAGALAGCLGAPRAQNQDDNPTDIDLDRIAADPTDVPPPVDWDEPREHEISMETVEATAEITPGTTFDYMTFDGQVPGPMVRVRRGDRIRFQLTNPEDSNQPHNMDFHAAYGPGGGAEDTTITPGETAEIEFKAMYPGVHIYHCAVPDFDHHISAGMFGAILVELEDGLPEVDRELYFGQHEIYTKGGRGDDNHHPFDFEAMNKEEPTFVVFNGVPYGFTEGGHGPITVNTDERIRIYFANGGPNLSSSWHAIGNVWTRLYRDGDLVSDPGRFVETTPVPPGSVSAAEIRTPVPGPVRLVDHAASRALKRGALGVIQVQGEER